MKIYDTGEEQTIDRVYNGIWDMWDVIGEGMVRKEKYADEFLKRIYEDITYNRIYYHKVDPIYK